MRTERQLLSPSGKLRIKFGDTLMAICEMRPLARQKCIEENKNPFDDC